VKLVNTQLVFDCPIHGMELQVLCWRAFQDENLDRWRKYEVSYNEVAMSNQEKEQLLESLRNEGNRY
jgi:hypothetical protein